MALFRAESSVSLTSRDHHLAVRVTVTFGSFGRRRSLRRDRRAGSLAAELATYTTPAELLDLEAVPEDYDDDQTDEIRTILAGQALSRLTSPRAGGLFC